MSPQVDAWVMTLEPSSPSEIVGWEMGARTCLHVRPGSLTILECRFNKTTHHQQSKTPLAPTTYGPTSVGAGNSIDGGRPRARRLDLDREAQAEENEEEPKLLVL